jgi:hypothetical protein
MRRPRPQHEAAARADHIPHAIRLPDRRMRRPDLLLERKVRRTPEKARNPQLEVAHRPIEIAVDNVILIHHNRKTKDFSNISVLTL